MNEIVKIDFNGDELVAFEEDGKVYISVSQACQTIGLMPHTQFRKINKDPVMQAGVKVSLMSDLFGNQETLFLEREFFHRWLNSVQPARVKNEVVRDKLVKYQFECVKAIDDYFTKGAAINENFLTAAPEEFINNLADTIAEKLGRTKKQEATSTRELRMQLARDRMSFLKEAEDFFGDFDSETKAVLKQQTIADAGFDVPNAPTWTEIDRWYAADYWKLMKSEGWMRNAYDSDEALHKVLGTYAAQISRRQGYEMVEVPQIAYGRRTIIKQYQREALELAFERLAREGKVAQQKVIQMRGESNAHQDSR